MDKGITIMVEKMSNGYKISAQTEMLFYPTKKALLSAVDKHFVEARKKAQWLKTGEEIDQFNPKELEIAE